MTTPLEHEPTPEPPVAEPTTALPPTALPPTSEPASAEPPTAIPPSTTELPPEPTTERIHLPGSAGHHLRPTAELPTNAIQPRTIPILITVPISTTVPPGPVERILALVPSRQPISLLGFPVILKIWAWMAAVALLLISISLILGLTGPAVHQSQEFVDLGFEDTPYFPWLVAGSTLAAGLAIIGAGISASIAQRPALLLLATVAGQFFLITSFSLFESRLPVVAGAIASTLLGLLRWSGWPKFGLLVQSILLGWPSIVSLFLVIQTPPPQFSGLDIALWLGPRALLQTQYATTLGALAIGLVMVQVGGELIGRHNRVKPLLSRAISQKTIVIIIVAKLAYFILRYTGVLGDSLGDAGLWILRGPLTWAHAAVVAVAVSMVAERKWRTPILERGRSIGYLLSTLPLIVIVFIGASTFGLTAIVGLGQTEEPSNAGLEVLNFSDKLVDNQWATALILAVIILIAATVRLVVVNQWTIGLLSIGITALWVLPVLSGLTVIEQGGDPPTFWASPTQVDVCLTLAVVVLFVVNFSTPAMRTALYARLLVVPFALTSAASVIPSILQKDLFLVLFVLTIAGPILWFSPHFGADPLDRTSGVMRLLATQLGLLTMYYIGFNEGSGFTIAAITEGATLAGLWLSIPVALLICVRTRPEGSAVGPLPGAL